MKHPRPRRKSCAEGLVAPQFIHPDAGESTTGQGGVLSRSFLGLLATQFLGAMNDNMFRWLVVPIGKDMVGPERAATALSVGLACFVLPYILLAAPAGYLADRFSKRTVIVGCKVAEIVIMVLGIATILIGNVYLMFAVVALMGTHSALFGPSKFGSIPEIVRARSLSAANGLVGLTTVLAIVVGTVAGNMLYWSDPAAGNAAVVALGPGAGGRGRARLAGQSLHPTRCGRPIPSNAFPGQLRLPDRRATWAPSARVGRCFGRRWAPRSSGRWPRWPK